MPGANAVPAAPVSAAAGTDPVVRWLVPVGRSGWAVAAGYLGILFIGVTAPFALICGVLALLDIRKHPEKTGKGRAWLGIVLGVIGTLILADVLADKWFRGEDAKPPVVSDDAEPESAPAKDSPSRSGKTTPPRAPETVPPPAGKPVSRMATKRVLDAVGRPVFEMGEAIKAMFEVFGEVPEPSVIQFGLSARADAMAKFSENVGSVPLEGCDSRVADAVKGLVAAANEARKALRAADRQIEFSPNSTVDAVKSCQASLSNWMDKAGAFGKAAAAVRPFQPNGKQRAAIDNGRRIVEAVIDSNLDREANSKGLLWPSAERWTSAAEYFEFLGKPTSCPGLPDIRGWCPIAAKGELAESDDAPFLVSSNLKIATKDLARHAAEGESDWSWKLDSSVAPFGDDAAVVVTRGGEVRILNPLDGTCSSKAVLYGLPKEDVLSLVVLPEKSPPPPAPAPVVPAPAPVPEPAPVQAPVVEPVAEPVPVLSPASAVPEPAPPPEEVSSPAPGSGAAFDEEVPSVTEEEKVAESAAKPEETGKPAAPPPPRPVLVVSAFVKEGGEGGPGKAAAASGAELLLGGRTYALPARVGLTKGRSYGPGRVVLEKDGKTWVGTLAKITVDWDGDRKTAVALEERTEPKAGTRETVRVDGVEFALRWCPSGWFRMGSRNDDSAAWDNEKPQVRVDVPSGFWTGETEVTQELWEKIMGENPSHNQKGGSFPVENVSWNMCREFVEKLNAHPGAKAAGLRFALPTEAQWEYACRAGTTGAFGGTGDLDDMGWHRWNSGNATHPVGEKKANAWGLRDMHGNVWEWCADTWREHPRGALDGGSAARAPGEYRVLRGGAYWAESRVCRSAARERSYPTNRSWYGGLRLVAFPDGK